MSEKAVLVCGGAGYIGSHVVNALAAPGHTAVIVDNLSTGHRAAVPDNVKLYEISIGDRTALGKVFDQYDITAVMHFCAHIYVGESVENPLKYYENNVVNGLALLETMIDRGVRQIVFSSSCAVYGQPDRIPIDEDCHIVPMSPYGRTKAMLEQIMGDFETAYGLRWVALRYFNAAGAMPDGSIGEDHNPETHLIPLVLRQALRDESDEIEPLAVFGDDYETPDGTCIRDYIHVLDLADAHVKALDYLAADEASLAMNLGNEQGFSVLEVIETCRKITGRDIPYKVTDRRAGDPPRLIGRSDLARRVLGWQPKYSEIETIVQTAWDWHHNHPGGFEY